MSSMEILPLINIHRDDVETPLMVCMCIIGECIFGPFSGIEIKQHFMNE